MESITATNIFIAAVTCDEKVVQSCGYHDISNGAILCYSQLVNLLITQGKLLLYIQDTSA